VRWKRHISEIGNYSQLAKPHVQPTIATMKAPFLLIITLIFATTQPLALYATSPEVANIRATQRAGTKLIDIYYDATDADNNPLTVSIQLYSNTTPLPSFSVSGDVGMGVTAGPNKHIIWNAGQDWNRNFTTNGRARIVVDDQPTSPPNASMVFVPAGFGQPSKIADTVFPRYDIFTSAFFMDKFEVSQSVWDTVHNWAITNGYNFNNTGTATGPNHPVTGISWYDAVKWCNARSEREGLTPVYYTDPARTQVYRTGQVLLDNNWVAWEANGYRLPTVAEWIKAYRGGQAGGFFPWPSYFGTRQDNINPNLANYVNSGDPFEDPNDWWSRFNTTPVGYYNGNQTPQGPNNPNGYGLYDMAGNVGEWCWDREFTNWYSDYAEARDDNSKGPNLGQGANRYWSGDMDYNAFERMYASPAASGYTSTSPAYGWGGTPIGFRCVRSR
jgi:formylglycine-generating enzyme required for sulfatase activity